MTTLAWRRTADEEPGLVRSAALALLIHIIFFGFLVFGLNWRNDPNESMVVDLWRDTPPQPVRSQPVIKEPIKELPKPIPVQEPVKPKPEPIQPTSEPVRIKNPPPRKPTIEIKEKTEPPKPIQEEKKVKPVPEKTPKPEPVKEKVAKPESVKEIEKKVAPEKELPEKEQKAVEQDVLAQLAAQKSKALDEIAKYKAMIQAKIRSRIVTPPDLPGNPMVEFRVTLLPGGDVLKVSLRKSSGYAAFDEAVERAIFLAKPLPIPPDPALFKEFRDFNLTVYYQDAL
ncbi:MAG: cell envelope integrity protein TolA [Nitrosomonas sp.]|nr:cell envelope integrity protein TolA [Nitrosomonas sp.]MBK7363764.1 cell envelope integrity protein TolA [Nitrosomonas sp.]